MIGYKTKSITTPTKNITKTSLSVISKTVWHDANSIAINNNNINLIKFILFILFIIFLNILTIYQKH